MKKTSFLLALAAMMLIGFNAGAQSKFGVIAGFTSSNTNVKDFDAKSVSLYHAGVTLKMPLFLGFSLQPSLLYQVKGTTLDKIESGSSHASFDMKVGYVEVPLSIQWGPDLGLFRPYVAAEPFIGFGINNKSVKKLSVAGVSATDYTVRNSWSDANIKRWEYGLGLGAGIEFLMFQVSARYFWNFGSLCDDNGNVNSGDIADTVKSAFKDGKDFNGVSVSVALLF
ncbi:MAG: PorT family protein [Bacteroidales bacterium]|jgi:opacity protein-like surface antigen|nr:PorT family protein [Bacteroidales bacterium]